MQVKEKPVSKCTVERQRNRRLSVLLAVFAAVVCLASLTVGIVLSVKNAARIAEKEQQITALQQQLDSEKEKNDTLGKENDDLKGKVESLEKENDALKITISQQGGVFPKAAYEGKKLVALTFDDGPGKYTAELLDFLKEHRVRATFFLLGRNAANYPSLVKRMDAEGHTVGNHSYSHPNLAKMSAAGVASQIGNCNAAIYKAIGRNASVLRCPGGSSNATVRSVAKSADLPIIYWSVDTKDWESRDKDKIMQVAFGDKGIKDGSIVLLHDIHRESVDAAKEMIVRLEKEGYTFATVPELLSVRKDGMQAGQSYSNGY
ncbi:MAG: polysaccharide deacetylase family protein [Clostridia bacterium]|nr:polysaccharide deacetylase family protein [Clostridia bacterium]